MPKTPTVTTRAKTRRPAETKTRRPAKKKPAAKAATAKVKLAPAEPKQVWRTPVPAAKPTRIKGPLTQWLLAEAVGTDTGLPPETVQAVQKATWDVIARTLAAGHSVTITNFGTWSAYRRAARKARNPQSGERVLVAAHWASRFRVAPRLAEIVRGHKQAKATVKKLPKGTLTGEQP
jgi:DNA-binding protein HU-beta